MRLTIFSSPLSDDASLDDLQAAVEAGTRVAATFRSDTTRFDGRLNASLARELVHRVERFRRARTTSRDEQATADWDILVVPAFLSPRPPGQALTKAIV
jgi:hypothetical protein